MLFTLVPVQSAVATSDGLAIAADIAMIVVGVAIVVLAIAGVALARKTSRTLDGVRTAVGQNLGPVSERARAISDNVEFISHALRTDVERLNTSVRALSDRLHQASDRMEERIEDFNALMEVVQEEAEGMFIDTAATMRGVREGAAALTRKNLPEPDHAEGALPEQDHAEGALPEADSAETVSDVAEKAPHGDGLEALPTRGS